VPAGAGKAAVLWDVALTEAALLNLWRFIQWESIDLVDAFHPQTILAHSLNGGQLPVQNGAPLRLRVERQLGYKHAKYVMRVEVTARLDLIGGGKGGFWEDRGYEWYAGI
jgi:DMSO/TMAO reductase YedYZ molybdopterin-dependent catalytic subunit